MIDRIDPCAWEIADLYGPEIVARLTRETGSAVPIVWNPKANPQVDPLSVQVCAFLTGFHVNAYGRWDFMCAELLPLTNAGMGRGVPWGARKPGETDWVDDVFPDLLAATTVAVRLVEAHICRDVCAARIGYEYQATKGRYPYRCQLATHGVSDLHQHGRHHWLGDVPPVDGNGPMFCEPAAS